MQTMETSFTSEAELSQFLLGCPLQLKISSNVCYCALAPWMKQSKRKVKRVRKLVQKFFTQDDCDVYLLHLIPHADRVCACPHGNYMLQELLTCASMSAIQIFISSVDIARIMTDEFGSRVVETMTEIYDGALTPLVLNRMAYNFGRLARDPRANYSIQKICANMPMDKYDNLMRVIVPHAGRLSYDPHGAYVIQVILNKLFCEFEWNVEQSEHFVEATMDNLGQEESVYSMLEALLSTLVDLGPKLIQHPRGNFTVQVMIRALYLCPDVEKKFVEGICRNLVPYSRCQWGTRVVECLMEIGGEFGKGMLLAHLLQLDPLQFQFFVQSESAQYLVPKVMMYADDAQKKKFAGLVSGAMHYHVSHESRRSSPSLSSAPSWSPNLQEMSSADSFSFSE